MLPDVRVQVTMKMDPSSQTIPEPLEALNGHPLGPYSLHLAECEPMDRRSGWRRVDFFLLDGDGTKADWSVLKGFYSVAGRTRGSWLDCDFYPAQSFGEREIDITEEGLALRLFEIRGEAITSHCMVAYEVWEHSTDLHAFTDISYRLGIPPAATPVGELLIAAGCVAGFKDWYIAEGGNEGPRKLQAEKPLTAAAKTEAMVTVAQSLIDYLARRPVGGAEAVEMDCRRRAVGLLAGMEDWPEEVLPIARSVAHAASGAEDLLLDGPKMVRKALKERRPPWSLEDGP
jgi:hypothetical protein